MNMMKTVLLLGGFLMMGIVLHPVGAKELSPRRLILPALLSRTLDYGLVFGTSAGIQFITASTLGVPSADWFANKSPLLSLWAGLTMSLPMWTYNSVLVATPHSGTLGQRLTQVRVVTDNGEPLTFGHSLLRTAVLFAGWELSHIAMFVPRNIATDEPAAWQLVGLSLGTLYLVSDLVTIVATGGRKCLADLLVGTRLVSTRTP